MMYRLFVLSLVFFSFPLFATNPPDELQKELQKVQKQTVDLQNQLDRLQKQLAKQAQVQKTAKAAKKAPPPLVKTPAMSSKAAHIHQSSLTVYRPDNDPESLDFYPTALVADGRVVTYIAGTPIVTSPYLGSRPAFDGSDYIVNISSINRDVRLMQQRRGLYRAYNALGYKAPKVPIVALSGKVQPVMTIGDPFYPDRWGDITLGSSELDVAAILNRSVEAYISLSYDESPPDVGGQRLSNSSVDLNMGFVNIGDLDKTPIYFTGGQLFVPFGRFSTSMISAPLTMIMARTKARPFILGYKSQTDSGPFAAVYGYRTDTTIGTPAAGGINLGYHYDSDPITAELGGSFISSMNDAGGMQFTGSVPGTTFGGFSSLINGSEAVHKVPAVGVHANVSVSRYSFTAEWVGATEAFRVQDLSFNGVGAKPQAAQLEAGMTFIAFKKPASVALGYQWSKDALALNLPEQRVAGVFNISIWKDTVESLEYRHDMNYAKNQYANGAFAPGFVNANTLGNGGDTDTVLAQIGIFF